MQSFLQARRFKQDAYKEHALHDNIESTHSELPQHPDQKVHCFDVTFENEGDKLDPRNWSYTKRLAISCIVTLVGFNMTWASAIEAATLPHVMEEFAVGETIASLGTGLYLIAFGLGSLFAGPMSETVGRNPVYLVAMGLFILCVTFSGLAPNLPTLLVSRFFAGLFGNTPLTCAGGTLADLWTPAERTIVIPLFSIGIFLGIVLAPVAGGWIVESHLSWRWCEWVTLALSGLVFAIIFLLQPETHAPTLLRWKAHHIRNTTGDSRYKAPAERSHNTFIGRLNQAMCRPFTLLIFEPIVMLIALYLVVTFVILFTFLDGFTAVFTETYNFSEGQRGNAFLSIAVGFCLTGLLIPVLSRYTKKAVEKREKLGQTPSCPPELRLWYAMIGAPGVPISLFWMGWSNDPSISPWCSFCGAALFGFSILCIYISSYQYIIDSYEVYASSALASITVLRYVVSGAVVPGAIPMYKNLGVSWTLTIYGGLGVVLVPLPFVFHRYGAWIRSKSRSAAVKPSRQG